MIAIENHRASGYEMPMLLDAKQVQTSDALAAARARLSVGPVPDWVVSSDPDYAFTSPKAKPITYLQWSVQSHSEKRASFYRVAMRLENMQAVQQEAQWRVEFEPRTQQIILHHVRVRRGDAELDHTRLDKIHLLQREAGLEGCVIDGVFTALLVLEDVRPGDVLDWSYTVERRSGLLPENWYAFWPLPLGMPLGRLQFVVRFNERRTMRWKASDPELTPKERREDGMVTWEWYHQKFSPPEPEPDLPVWFIPFPWIQISDCTDWGGVAQAVAKAWQPGATDEHVTQIVREIEAKETELLPRLELALRQVQDEFRYLSVNLDHGAQIPTLPDIVARRRFGDCKDLSFLLVQLLQRLGINARPVLLSVRLQRSIHGMLPSPNLFDHVGVEYEVGREKRWVDVTIKNQGGGPLKRALPCFGFGLVVDPSTKDLTAPPPASVARGIFRVKETVLLDTTGANSYVAMVSTAEGAEADIARQQFESVPFEELSRQRLQYFADRYRHARPVGEIRHRFDREANEFHIAEIYEVNGFLYPRTEPGVCDFPLPVNLVNGSLRLPEQSRRRQPFALPRPATIMHTTEIQTRGGQPPGTPRCRIETPLMHFTRQNRCMPGYWSTTLTLHVFDDALLPEQLEEHGRKLAEIWREATWNFIAPVGVPAPNRNRMFGALPPPPRQDSRLAEPAMTSAAEPITTTLPAQPKPALARAPIASPAPLPFGPPSRRSRSRMRTRHSSDRSRKSVRVFLILFWTGAILFILLLVALLILKHTSRSTS